MSEVSSPSERARLSEALVLLQRHVGAEKARELPRGRVDAALDALVRVGEYTFAVALERQGTASRVARASEHLLAATRNEPSRIALFIAPTVTASGREACQQLGLNWMDLAGNADIRAEGLRVLVATGHGVRPRGRPESVFTPRRSRIVRHLLMFPDTAWTQRELAKHTGLSEGDTSRVVRRMEDERMVVRETNGGVRPAHPELLLADWREAYAFERHAIARGHVQARSGEHLTRNVDAWLAGRGIVHAATGLAGAWFWTRFAAFRIATFLLPRPLTSDEESELGFFRDESGANLWLVTPEDGSALEGAQERGGVSCAHPLQIYLDLKAHPERAAEAAEQLRAQHLTWS